MIVSLQYVPANNTIQNLCHTVRLTFQPKVTVVSTNDVVNEALVTVVLPFVTIVQLGLPALSVSILIHKSTHGETNFLNASFNVVKFTPVQNTGIATLVFHTTSPIFCAVNELVFEVIESIFQPFETSSLVGFEPNV